MTFSYATTVSEADWTEWITDQTDVTDGGLTLARTASIQQSTLGESVVDLAVDPAGMLYTLDAAGRLSQYNPRTDSRQRLLDSADLSLDEPRAICASESRVFVAGADDERIVTVSPRLRNETGALQSPIAAPVELTFDNGTIYVLDGDERIACLGTTEELTVDWWVRSPVDIAVADDLLYVLDTVDDEPTIRLFQGEREVRTDSYPLSTDAFEIEGTRFVPTAIAAPRGSLVLAGTVHGERGSWHGLFEWDETAGEFEQRHELEGRCRRLISRPLSHSDRRVFYALVGDRRICCALQERQTVAAHPHRDRHVGLAFHRYDAGVDDISWHRLALDLARSSASTQVRLRYFATNEPTVLPFDCDDGEDRKTGEDSANGEDSTSGEDSETSTDGQNSHHGDHTTQPELDALAETARSTLQSIGVDSVWELASRSAAQLADRDGQLETTTVRSWQETARRELARHAETTWTLVDEIDPEDILLRDANGRYLYVAVELVGTPTASPRIDAVTAYCPRQSYLRYLPELYQNDDRSAQFLERYLSTFETSFVDIESEIEQLPRYFDPDGVPSESLAWLEDWLAADEYRDWPESARREYLARAPELYQKRGTRAGLRETLELYLRHANPRDGVPEPASHTRPNDDRSATADESATTTGVSDSNTYSSHPGGDLETGHRLFFFDATDFDRADGAVVEREYGSMLAGERSFALFCGPVDSAAERAAIETIVETEKPAHVDARVLALDDEFVLGDRTFLGLNSALQTRTFAMGEAVLGEDTVLAGPDSM
ncbi:phage tail protein [Natrialba hulunbeirensis JCM 10989]|uniref:Phage tail protein n=1 Tax=Natrialba hulunbeirensis JCM 10989 TaxID=1227493 RepID=M0A1J3_9EURY|nr:phage tail protein [Natrialba hulunbeirensis]ELY91712.1 phage tail protein [Natrialba hulunbeirensis JCM 10989]